MYAKHSSFFYLFEEKKNGSFLFCWILFLTVILGDFSFAQFLKALLFFCWFFLRQGHKSWLTSITETRTMYKNNWAGLK